MELRSGIYKGVHGTLPQQYRSQFAEGLSLLFSRWTALGLAIDNDWGGPSSRQKAEQLYKDVLHWFYTHTGGILRLIRACCNGLQKALHSYAVCLLVCGGDPCNAGRVSTLNRSICRPCAASAGWSCIPTSTC